MRPCEEGLSDRVTLLLYSGNGRKEEEDHTQGIHGGRARWIGVADKEKVQRLTSTFALLVTSVVLFFLFFFVLRPPLEMLYERNLVSFSMQREEESQCTHKLVSSSSVAL